MTEPGPLPRLFDSALLSLRQRRALVQGAEAFLLDRVVDDFIERLDVVLRQFGDAVDLGTPGSRLTELLRPRMRTMRSIVLDAADREPLPLTPDSIDLAVSALALQSVNDLPGVLAQVRRALRPDGLFLAALIGGETLTELRQSFAIAESEQDGGVSPRVFPFVDLRDAGALLQRAGFALPVTDVDRIVVRYDHAIALMRDLRRMGATNILADRRRVPLRRSTLLRVGEVYADKFADQDGRIRATFDVVWMSGWAPHDSQQKPLKPGSAKFSLEEAVKRRPR